MSYFSAWEDAASGVLLVFAHKLPQRGVNAPSSLQRAVAENVKTIDVNGL
jgi:hypothetical protein